MAISDVEKAIGHVRSVVNEWKEVGAGWDEWHTRYALIDPMLRALGWDTTDPKQCHPEFPRGNNPAKKVDYVLFAEATPKEIWNLDVLPDIIIEAKALGESLDAGLRQLREYVRSSPRMEEGIAVLTNGTDWWLYDLTQTGSFANKKFQEVDVRSGSINDPARILEQHLGREHWT